MRWIKVGQRFINVEQVIDVSVTSDGSFWLTTVVRSNNTVGILLQGAEKEDFRRWIELEAQDLSRTD